MTLMAVEIDTLDSTRYSDKDYDLILFALSNMVGEIVSVPNRLTPVVLNNRQLTILGTSLPEANAWSGELQSWAESIQWASNKFLGITVSVGFSYPTDDWVNIPAACKQAEESLRYRVRLGNEAIIYSEDVLSPPSEDASYPFRLEQELMEAIKSDSKAQAEEKFKGYIRDLVKPPFRYQEYQVGLMRIVTGIGGLLLEEGIPLSALVRGEATVFEQMSAIRTTDEMEAWFVETFIGPAMAMLEERRSHKLRSISDAVIGMIHQAFDTDLTLEYCASQINYHPHYVSKVFRHEVGVTFSDYLLRFRLQMAKRWLTETDMTITEIAERLKYTNATNFIRYFRKIEGTTPGKYRENASNFTSIPGDSNDAPHE
jgi:AraC-like DNA-binding protein